MLYIRSTVFYLGMRYHRCVGVSRYLHHPGNMMQSSTKAESGKKIIQGIVDDNYLGDHECLDLTGVRYVRTNTKIYHRSTTIDGGGGTIRNFGLNQVLFVFIVLERCERGTHSENIEEHTSNIFNRSSFETIRRSNFCLSLTALSEIFSRAG